MGNPVLPGQVTSKNASIKSWRIANVISLIFPSQRVIVEGVDRLERMYSLAAAKISRSGSSVLRKVYLNFDAHRMPLASALI